ncbi:phage holin family protein [Tomitella biformata]|uniref:phage holin family protein n=1 Tax=Tomitella biformata TaxID=630403 RepID=UPI000467AF4F|nr:phage holin family protein [Tomitella biformata]
MPFLARVATTAVAIWAAASWLSGITVDTNDHGTWASIGIYLLVALVFTLINMYVKPLVTLLSLPLLILTLGLFYLVVNALMLLLAAWVTQKLGWGLEVDGFWTAVGGAIVIAIVNMVLSALIPDKIDGRR